MIQQRPQLIQRYVERGRSLLGGRIQAEQAAYKGQEGFLERLFEIKEHNYWSF